MRIIRGKYRGKKIQVPSNFIARPTTDFAKEAIFNIIENNFEIEEIKVLDLFTGTGSIGFEFLSRGAKSVTSVEIEKKYFAFIKRIGLELFPNNYYPINADAFKFIKTRSLEYDIIFADPPFDSGEIEAIPDLIMKSGKIKQNTVLILEHSEQQNFSETQYFLKTRKYGKVNFSFFCQENFM
jgi:16S rRNA (guanine(966)-N(2))-methyltransferase RsmD